MRSLRSLVVAALIAVPVFAKAKGHLYRVDTHQVIPFEFTRSVFSAHGKIWLTLPTGEKLTGEYSVIREGGQGWGSVYSSVSGNGYYATGSGRAYSGWSSATAQGTGLLSGDNNKAMTCEFIVGSIHGSGGCQDQDGNLYKLIF